MQRGDVPNDIVEVYTRHTKVKTRPLLGDYLRLLRLILDDFSRVYIIIDGLDECSEANSTRSTFLAGVNAVRRQTCTFITSRYLPSIETELHGVPRLQLEADDEDIERYLIERLGKWDFLKRHLQKDPSLRETIISSPNVSPGSIIHGVAYSLDHVT